MLHDAEQVPVHWLAAVVGCQRVSQESVCQNHQSHPRSGQRSAAVVNTDRRLASVASIASTERWRSHLSQWIRFAVLQSNPIFIVKTQLTERSRITDKHRENQHLKKHHEHWKREKSYENAGNEHRRVQAVLINGQDIIMSIDLAYSII